MQKWEYLVLWSEAKDSAQLVENIINDYGTQGWGLTGIWPRTDGRAYLFFKRPKREAKTSNEGG